jgi:Cu+-exporting ATPase
MMVTVAGAAHRAQHGGRDYYFCCGGCRERFLASPAKYLVAEAGA